MMEFLTGRFSESRREQAVENLNGFQVRRLVRRYEKNGDRFVSESLLNGFSLSELQDLFGESKQNPMTDSYPISDTQASHLQKALNITFDLDTFDYFLECDAV